MLASVCCAHVYVTMMMRMIKMSAVWKYEAIKVALRPPTKV